jgi:hypothetical protein
VDAEHGISAQRDAIQPERDAANLPRVRQRHPIQLRRAGERDTEHGERQQQPPTGSAETSGRHGWGNETGASQSNCHIRQPTTLTRRRKTTAVQVGLITLPARRVDRVIVSARAASVQAGSGWLKWMKPVRFAT